MHCSSYRITVPTASDNHVAQRETDFRSFIMLFRRRRLSQLLLLLGSRRPSKWPPWRWMDSRRPRRRPSKRQANGGLISVGGERNHFGNYNDWWAQYSSTPSVRAARMPAKAKSYVFSRSQVLHCNCVKAGWTHLAILIAKRSLTVDVSSLYVWEHGYVRQICIEVKTRRCVRRWKQAVCVVQ